MTIRSAADIGMSVDEVDTPALLIDLEVFEKNLERMAAAVGKTSVRVRPHAKTHKSPVVALRQIALGAVGVCCQKVSEAEVMVQGGVGDVLVTNQIVGKRKLAHLAALSRQARIAVCADDPANVRDLNDAALAFGTRLPVFVEVNVGSDRCGVEPGEPALALARQICRAPGLRFAGLHAYHGSAQHIREFSARREAIGRAADRVRQTVGHLRRDGIDCEVVTGGGTGTYAFEIGTGLFSEVQPGSYVFMDADYGKNLDEDGQPVRDFEQSLFVLTTVMSRPTRGRAIVDAGLKALSVDSGMPLVCGMPDVEYLRASDEHGKLFLRDEARSLHVGDKVRLIPGHCDPTVNLFDWYVGVRGTRVEALWPVAARGAVL